MQTEHDPSRPTHEQRREDPIAVAEIKRLSAQITRLEAVNAALLAACKVLTIDEFVSKTIRDIDPQAFAQLRSAIALAEKWRSEQTPEPSLTTSHARD